MSRTHVVREAEGHRPGQLCGSAVRGWTRRGRRRRKPAGSGVELLPHPHPEVRSRRPKSPLMERRKAMRFRGPSLRTRCRKRDNTIAPRGAPSPLGIFEGEPKPNPRHRRAGTHLYARCLKFKSERTSLVAERTRIFNVMAGLVPAIPITKAPCSPDRDHRDKPGDDKL